MHPASHEQLLYIDKLLSLLRSRKSFNDETQIKLNNLSHYLVLKLYCDVKYYNYNYNFAFWADIHVCGTTLCGTHTLKIELNIYSHEDYLQFNKYFEI